MPERYDLELGRCVQLGRRRRRIFLRRRLDFSSLLKAGARAVVRMGAIARYSAALRREK